MSNAPKWFNHVNAILDTIGTGEFNALQDKITWQVMVKVVPGLMSKKGIDNGLLNSFITNIRTRSGERDFSFEGPLVLTRNQKTHAKSLGWDKVPSLDELRKKNADLSRIGSGLEADTNVREEANQQFIRILSALYPHAIRDVSAKMTLEAAQNCDFLAAMEGNERKGNMSDMTSAYAAVHEEAVSIQDSMIHTPAHQGSLMDPGQSIIHPEQESKSKVSQSSSAARNPAERIDLSLWIKEFKGKMCVSGNYEVNGETYKLVFKSYDATMEKLMIEGTDNKDFRDWMNTNVYPVYRNANPGTDLCDTAQLSGIYANGDSFANKDPLATEMVVGLLWDENNKMTEAFVVVNNEIKKCAMKQNGKHGNLYKGSI